jgi:hypothetical protein
VFTQPTITVTSTTGSFNTPLPLTFTGGGSVGAPVFSIGTGSTATGCAIAGTAVAPTLVSTSAGTCTVVLNIGSDTVYQLATSDPTVVTINPILASAPRLPIAFARNKAALVQWQAPTFTGGIPLSTYKVTASPLVNGVARTCTTTGRSCTVGGLLNKVAYKFSVVANNTVGPSPAVLSAPVIVGTPSAPRISKVAPLVKKMSVTISWNPPTLANGSPVTSYQVAWSTNAGKSFGSFKSVGKARSAIRAGLSKTGKYAVKVRAVNASGPGDFVIRVFTYKG